MTQKILIGNIQRFCVSDGDGIRTTVFLKGCDVNCPWCSNPENKSNVINYFDENGIKKQYGKYMTDKQIVDTILKDKAFYGKDGGVTYSGGEPLLSISSIRGLLETIKGLGISQWIETSLFAPTEKLEFAIGYMDNFIIDMKNIIPEQCKKYIGGDVRLYLDNFQRVVSKYKNPIIRIPLIEPYTCNQDNIEAIKSLLDQYPNIQIQLFKVHNMGMDKYKRLSVRYEPMKEISDEKVNQIYELLSKKNDKVEILKL